MRRTVMRYLGRDKLFSGLMIVSMTVTVLLTFILFSSNKIYDDRMKNLSGSSESSYEIDGSDYDEYQNLILVKKINNCLVISALFFTVLNCAVVFHVWLARRSYEIAVRKTFGTTNCKLWLKLLAELAGLCAVSSVAAIVLYLTMSAAGIISGSITAVASQWIYVIMAELAVCVCVLTVNSGFIYKLSPAQLLCKGID